MNDTIIRNTTRVWLGANNGKLSKVIEFQGGKRVAIPVNKDGSVRWFDDTKLLKKNK